MSDLKELAETIARYAEKDGVRIGFGECRGQILPATEKNYDN